MLLIMGVALMGLLGAAFMLTRTSEQPGAAERPQGLTALETALGREIVLYVDGADHSAVRDQLLALDKDRGALAARAVPRTLVDLDVYVMLRADWDVFRAVQGHDLSEVIRENARDKAPDAGLAWFEASISSPEGTVQRLLVILATEAARDNLGDFCFAVAVYDLARFSRNGARLLNASDGQGSYWKQCQKMGWTNAADLPAGN